MILYTSVFFRTQIRCLYIVDEEFKRTYSSTYRRSEFSPQISLRSIWLSLTSLYYKLGICSEQVRSIRITYNIHKIQI